MLSFESSSPSDPESWERLKAAVELENAQRLIGLRDMEARVANIQPVESELSEAHTYKSCVPPSMRHKLSKRELASLPPLPGSVGFEQFIGLHECFYTLRYGRGEAPRQEG